jgi:hypothetical protein
MTATERPSAIPPITLFTPLSGRTSLWEGYSRFLTEQQWPHQQIRLILMDTSQSPEFGAMVRDWVAQCDYPQARLLTLSPGRPGLADERRVSVEKVPQAEVLRDLHLAMVLIYNRMKAMVQTPYLWVIEDDIIPPVDALGQLFDGMCPETVSVSGVYESRYDAGAMVAWDQAGKVLRTGSGIQEIGGNGFGCVLFRAAALKQHIFTSDLKNSTFDREFYRRFQPSQRVKLHWDVRCQHVAERIAFPPCPHTFSDGVSEATFDEAYYLGLYADVADAVAQGKLPNGLTHYLRYGQAEGRWARPLETASAPTKEPVRP